jgi:predicted transcriptional regulator
MNYVKKITIIKHKKPKQLNLNEEIQWFSSCLGMFNKRDKEKSQFRIFVNLLKEKKPLSSDQIANCSNLSRSTAIHHISKLKSSGLIIEKDKRYFLRVYNLEGLIKHIEKDVLSTFKIIREISREIDKKL